MFLKKKIRMQHNVSFFHAVSYRLPQLVREVLLFTSGISYPICPRCDNSLDREYMSFCDQCGQRLAWTWFDYASVTRVPCNKTYKQSTVPMARREVAVLTTDLYSMDLIEVDDLVRQQHEKINQTRKDNCSVQCYFQEKFDRRVQQ